MLVGFRRFTTRCVLVSHLSQPAVHSTLVMVHTRRATRLATQDELEGKAMRATPTRTTRSEHAARPLKRARKERQEEEQRSGVVAGSQYSDADAGSAMKSRSTRQKHVQPAPKPSDFPPRVSSAWKVGAHVSAAGGVENTVVNAARVRANAFALFVKSQRKWSSPPLTDANVASFKARMLEFGYDPKHILPHGSYLINLGNPDEAKREKSYQCFLDDLQRCERLGLIFYNFHPGSTVGNATKEESISHIAQCLNRAHKETLSVVTVIENMSGAKNIIGSQFTELRDIIEQVEDKSRVGVCLDTCHMYAAGYDISTKAGWDKTMAMFDEQVGLSYLRGMHLNDSKTPLGSKKDRHENIGLYVDHPLMDGTLGLPAFYMILSDPRVQHIPLILETPTFEAMEVWECEITALNALSEAGSRSKATEEEGKTLEGLLDDIRSVIREYRDPKKKVTTKSRAKAGKRRKTNTEDDEAISSDDDDSCTERNE